MNLGLFLEYYRTVFESEICEMLQFMHVKILFLKFSLCQGTLRDGRRTMGQSNQQCKETSEPNECVM